jgi:hypothetical protein
VSAGEGAEEGGALLRIVAELMTQDAEGAGRIAEAQGGFRRRELVDEVGAEGFVLAVQRLFGGKEEGGGLGFRSKALRTGTHASTMLQEQKRVNMFFPTEQHSMALLQGLQAIEALCKR